LRYEELDEMNDETKDNRPADGREGQPGDGGDVGQEAAAATAVPPDVSLTPEELAVLREMELAEAAEELAPQIEELAAVVEERARVADLEAEAGVRAHRDYAFLKGLGRGVRDATIEFGEKRRQIGRDEALSEVGKQQALEAARARLNDAIERLRRNGIEGAGGRLMADFPRPGFRSDIPPDVGPLASLWLARARIESPAETVEGVIAHLGRALDPAEPPETWFRSNLILREAGLPLARAATRRPDAGPIRPLAERLVSILKLHLATTLGGAGHDKANEVVRAATRDFGWLLKTAAEAGEWDPLVVQSGAGFFDWD
jgi:hypothetical protein